MSYTFDSGRPIYAQLLELISRGIASGEYKPGQKLPGVREMAMDFGVNPNTVQRTMGELERQGLVFAERTTGRFVTRDEELIKRIREELAAEKIAGFFRELTALGFTPEEICGEVNAYARSNR